MADQVAQSASAAPKPMMSIPYLRIIILGSNGNDPERHIGAPIMVGIPRELSLRIASMHVMEFVMKEFKRIGFKDALKAIGLK